jgi:hypothetical protein
VSRKRSGWFRRWRDQRDAECIQQALVRATTITCEEVLPQLPALVVEEAAGKRTGGRFADASVHLLRCPTCLLRCIELTEELAARERCGRTTTPPWRLRYGRDRQS